MLLTKEAWPRIVDRSREGSDRLLAEETSQDSKHENKIAVEKPPRRRPTNRTGRLGTWMMAHAQEYVTQNIMHIRFLPLAICTQCDEYHVHDTSANIRTTGLPKRPQRVRRYPLLETQGQKGGQPCALISHIALDRQSRCMVLATNPRLVNNTYQQTRIFTRSIQVRAYPWQAHTPRGIA